MLEIEYLVEIVLFHVYGMLRARLEAFATVNASIFIYCRQSSLDTDGLRGAEAHAVRTSDTGGAGYF